MAGNVESRVIITKKNPFDNFEIKANEFLQKNAEDKHYGPIIRNLNTYIRPTINSMYQDAEFLDKILIDDLIFVES